MAPRRTLHVGHTGSSCEPDLQSVSQPFIHHMHGDHIDGVGNHDGGDSYPDICSIYDCEWCMHAAPAAPEEKEDAGSRIPAACVYTTFSEVWDCLDEVDVLLNEMATRKSDLIAQRVVLSLDELIPDGSGIDKFEAVLEESDQHLIACVGSRLVEFRAGMVEFTGFVWGEFELANVSRDLFPIYINGDFVGESLIMAHDILSEFAGFSKPCFFDDFFEVVGD